MVTRITTLFVLIAFCVMPCLAKTIKGNGTIITKQVSVSDYSAVILNSSTLGTNNSWFNLFSRGNQSSHAFNYKQGESASLQISIDENLYPYLKVTTNNGELTIFTKDGEQLIPTSFKVNGTSKGLNKIHTSGNMDFILQSSLSGDNLEVVASGGSDINMNQPVKMSDCTITASGGSDINFSDLTCETFGCRASGGSDITLKGKADKGQFKASGGADIKASDFVVTNLECSASGGSDMYVHAMTGLKASASGGSDIHYKGNPKASTSTSGGGDIYKEGR